MATKQASKKPGTALTLWEQEMQGAAAKAAKVEKVFGEFKSIGVQSGFMMIDGDPVEGNSIDVIILASAYHNKLYTTEYNPNTPTVPDCYAYSDPNSDSDDPEADMVAADSDNPQGQEDPEGEGAAGNPCSGCWANVMGSADRGRGKACQNTRRLLCITEDSVESAETLKDAEVRSVNIPVMSTKGWAKYVKDVLGDQVKRPPYGVVTTLKIVPDPKAQFRWTFAFKELVNFDQDLWDAMKAKVAAANKDVVAPYPKQADLDAMAAAEKPVKPQGRMAKAMASAKKAPVKTAPAKVGAKARKF